MADERTVSNQDDGGLGAKLTLLDYFAGQALHSTRWEEDKRLVAREAWDLAEAMLREKRLREME